MRTLPLLSVSLLALAACAPKEAAPVVEVPGREASAPAQRQLATPVRMTGFRFAVQRTAPLCTTALVGRYLCSRAKDRASGRSMEPCLDASQR